MTKFNLFDHFAVSNDKEVQGIWVYPIGEGDDAPAFKVARVGGANREFITASGKALKPYGPMIQKGSANFDQRTLDVIKELNFDVFVDHALRDWKNVKNAAGETLSFSKANAKELLRALPELFEKLFTEASDIGNFRPDTEADSKN